MFWLLSAIVLPSTDYNYAESLSTLQFANRAKNIKNTTRKNEVGLQLCEVLHNLVVYF